MRLRPLLPPVVATVCAALGWLWWRAPWNLALLAATGALLALAVAAPRLYAPLQRRLERIGVLIASAFTWLVLGALFALIFIPGRLLLVLLRRDPLRGRTDGARSAWTPLPPATDPARFRRLY